jgi:nucleotide-binding universal stress UspA family protein
VKQLVKEGKQLDKVQWAIHAAADVSCELVSEHNGELLVIGNKGMNRRVLGSVPRSVCQRAPCSVVVARTT